MIYMYLVQLTLPPFTVGDEVLISPVAGDLLAPVAVFFYNVQGAKLEMIYY